MKRGEIWWVNFDPSLGGETQKIRPAIIVSNDAANKFMNRVQVIPMTSNLAKCYPCEAYVEFDGTKSKAMADQLTTVSKARLQKRGGEVSALDMSAVEAAIKIQLGL